MKIIECEQRSVEWMQARAGILTASEFNQILTPKLEPRKGQMVETYMAKKLAEWWLGGPLVDFNTFDMDQGEMLEKEAIPWYELEYSVEIQRVGFITTDDGSAGCSPDGLMRTGPGDHHAWWKGLEIKCPKIYTHLGYVLDGKLPDEYAAQVHGSLYVTGLSVWTFVSYHRKTPALVLSVQYDGSIAGRIREAIEAWLIKFEQAKERLIEINGGPPPRLIEKPKPTPKPEPKEEDFDLMP